MSDITRPISRIAVGQPPSSSQWYIDVVPEPSGPIVIKVGEPLPQHPGYQHLRRQWDFLQLSFRGGYGYGFGRDAGGNDVFVKHEREVDGEGVDLPGVNRRRMLSVFKNFCRPILCHFNDFVFRSPLVQRDESNAPWQEFVRDVDGQGADMQNVMRGVLLTAAKLGRGFVLMQTNRLPDQPIINLAQQREAGIRQIALEISPLNVLDWRRDERGHMTSALVQDTATRAALYSADTVQLITLDNGVVSSIRQLSSRMMLLIEAKPFGGVSQIQDIAEVNRQIYNLDSLLRAELYGSHFTQHVVFGVVPAQIDDATLGTYRLITIGPADARMERIGADTSQAASIREAIADDIREIYRIAGLRSGDPTTTATPQSGVSKAFDFHEIDAQLGAIADEAERVEGVIGELFNALGGGSRPERTQYPDTFAVSDLSEELRRTLDVLAEPMMPREVKRRQLAAYARVAFPGATMEDMAMMSEPAEEPAMTMETVPE